MKLSRLVAAAAVAAFVPVATALPASAREWHPIEGHDDLLLATCSDGSEIRSAPADGRYSMSPILDADGNETGMLLKLRYDLAMIHDSGQVIHGNGVANITFDWATSTSVATGGGRNVHIKGDGWVLKEAGRVVATLDNEILVVNGIWDGDITKLCPYFGVEG